MLAEVDAGLDAIDEIVADPRFHLPIEYTDHADGRHRHLVRLRLDAPQGRRRSPTLLDIYTSSDRRFAKV